jgi:protein-disulfide isomerase
MWPKIRAGLAVGLGILLLGLVIFSVTRPKPAIGSVWHEGMTLGDKEKARNHFIVYMDIFCPFCDSFSRAWLDNKEEFMRTYIDSNEVFLEYRLAALLAGIMPNSERGGESGYCAADQGEFWAWYTNLLAKLWEDYQSRGVNIPVLGDDYYIDAARDTDIDIDKFTACLENNEMLVELNRRTADTQRNITGGVPYFVFNDFVSSGFEGGWNAVKTMFKAGGAVVE